jgi:hypothetical protein
LRARSRCTPFRHRSRAGRTAHGRVDPQQYFVEDGLDTNGRVRASIGSDITEMLRRLTREQTAIEAADARKQRLASTDMGIQRLLERGTPRLLFIISANIATFEDQPNFSAYMMGLQEGMMYASKYPKEAEALVTELVGDQREDDPSIVEMLNDSVEEYHRAGGH